jgi:hypothetical protein
MTSRMAEGRAPHPTSRSSATRLKAHAHLSVAGDVVVEPDVSENAATVGAVVAEILDALIDPDIPLELRDVVRLRSATRRVLEAHLPPEDEDRLLAGLARRAARSALPLWSLAAMEAEILEPEQLELLPTDVVGRAARFAAGGTRLARPATFSS